MHEALAEYHRQALGAILRELPLLLPGAGAAGLGGFLEEPEVAKVRCGRGGLWS